jgi:hypothetical protein
MNDAISCTCVFMCRSLPFQLADLPSKKYCERSARLIFFQINNKVATAWGHNPPKNDEEEAMNTMLKRLIGSYFPSSLYS